VNLRLLAAGIGLAAAFVGGFQVATWRAEARYQKERQAAADAYYASVQQAVAETQAANERTRVREAELAGQLTMARQETEGLRREIAERPVIRQIVRQPTPAGECPAVPTVDWGVFATLYNRAASGAAAPRAADARDGAVSGNATGHP